MRINAKLGIWTAAVILAVYGLALPVHYRIMKNEEIARLEYLGDTIGPIIEPAVSESMRTHDERLLLNTIQRLAAAGPINTIRIIDRFGVVRAGTAPDEIGKDAFIPAVPCQRCAEEGRRCVTLKEEGILRWYQPLKNRRECWSCHDPSLPYNGAVIIDFAVAQVEKQTRTHILRDTLLFFTALSILGLVIYLISNRLVINRLNSAVKSLRRFEQGDYGVRLPAEGSDEISDLGRAFNTMADAIAHKDEEKDLLIQRISASQRAWRATFDCITDLVTVHDRQLRIILANKAVADYFGFRIQDIIGKKCYELFHGSSGSPSDCPHKTTMNENRPVAADNDIEINGRVMRLSTYPYYSIDGELAGSVHVARDITEARQREMRLIINERLALLGRMASIIAHEINNPLSAIAGCAEGLMDRLERGEFDKNLYEKYLGIIQEEITQCKRIISETLSFARQTPLGREPVDINKTIENALSLIELQGRLRSVVVVKDLYACLLPVQGNEAELRQAFLAVLTNALDAMEDEGTLTIKSGVEGDNAIVSISDTGPGIPPEAIKKIFDPFFTTKTNKGGTGLGLSIAYRIISDHGGNIEAISVPGRGAEFKITLPYNQQ